MLFQIGISLQVLSHKKQCPSSIYGINKRSKEVGKERDSGDRKWVRVLE